MDETPPKVVDFLFLPSPLWLPRITFLIFAVRVLLSYIFFFFTFSSTEGDGIETGNLLVFFFFVIFYLIGFLVYLCHG